MNRFKIVLLLLCCTVYSLAAQQVQVNVMIQPPYSNHIGDYVNSGDNVFIRLTNTTMNPQNVKLIPSLEGNNGISVRVRDDFNPLSAIVLSPGETRLFTFNQLRPYNDNINQSHLIIQGISLTSIESAGVIPEGTYTLCVKALDYNTGMLLSGSGGCTGFMISSYDPPIILSPQDQVIVDLPQPQMLNFQWTPTGISGKTRYTIQIVDVSSMGFQNPYDAFNNPAVGIYYEQSNIPNNVLIYSMGLPPLIPGNTYAVQLTAYDPQGQLSFKNNGKSNIHVFTIKDTDVLPDLPPAEDGQDEAEEEIIVVIDDEDFIQEEDENVVPFDPNDVADCMNSGACQENAPNCDDASAPMQGATVFIGKFKMTVTSIQGGNGSGEIEIPYMDTKVEVEFQNLTVNAQNQACGASQVWAKSAHQNLIPNDFLKNTEGVFNDNSLDWSQIQQHIQQNNKRVSLFDMNNPIAQSLPYVLDLGPSEITILGLVFTPTAAYANIAFAAPIPMGDSNSYFSMGMKGVCIRPNGFGISEADARLSLGNNLEKALPGGGKFILESGNDGSYVEFNCKGVQNIRLKGSIAFGRDRVVPLNEQNEIVPAPAQYTVSFDANFSSINDWITEASSSHPAFTSAQANGFAIGFSSVVLDFSRTQNPDAFAFPGNHPMHNDPVKNHWTGLVLTEPRLSLPNYLKRSDNQKVSVDISNIVLDGEGLWTLLDINNIIQNTHEGSLGGWGFSIDQLSLDIRKSMLQGGGMNGKVNLPITEVGLGYDANYTPGNDNEKMLIEFGITLQDDLDIDMIFAQANLANNSTFGVTIEGNKVNPSAVLHGSLTIGWEKDGDKKPDDEQNSVSSFSLPTLNFQGFEISNNDNDIPQLNLQSMELSNPNAQGKLSGFPIKFKGNPSFQNYNPEVGFKMGLEFTLSKDNANGISGSTDFTIFAKYDQEKKRYAYDRTELNCITLDIDVAVAQIEGSICIYKNDDFYGDGFSGSVSATITGIGVTASIALQVGNVDNYDYFYFEALVKSGQGLPITATMSLYGLGGGFHYNMERTDREVSTIDGYQNVVPPQDFIPGYSPSGLLYTPKKGTIGFSATVVFGLTGGSATASAFNGDLTLWMTFTGSNGIEKMGLNGGGYAMQPLNNREAATITGEFAITINFVTSTFDLGVDLNVGLGSMVSGTASINMHASPDEWFIYIGSWEAPNPQNYEPWEDKKRNKLEVDLKIAQFDFNMYFMMGSNMPDLPPLPGKILANMQTQGGGMIQDNRSPAPDYNAQTPGFAFGAGFYQKLDFQVLIFYANIEFFAGFDVVLKSYQNVPGCESIGINGWFAKGQAYAYLGIDAGLYLDTWFYEGEWPIVKINCSAVIEAQFTNPNYVKGQVYLNVSILQGLITVNKNVKFEAGEQMKCGDDFNPFGDLPIVSEIFPDQGDEVEVYDDVRIAFNYPNKTFEVFNEEEPEEAPRYFYYSIHSISLKKGGATIPLSDNPIYSKDGYSAKWIVKNNEFLPELSTLNLYFEVRGYEAKPGPNPLLATEKYEKTFETKKRPDHIPANQLLSTNPVVRQRFFLKEDHVQGFVKTIGNKDWCYLFNTSEIGDPTVFDQSKTQYIVQFFETGSGNTVEVPCNCVNGEIRYIVPYEQLKQETIYRIRVMARLEYRPKSNINIQGGQLNLGNTWQTGSKQVEIVQGAHKVNRYLLEDNSPKTFDHRLMKTAWFFRTSKYNSLSAKLASFTLDQSTYTKLTSSHYIPRLRIKEYNLWGEGNHEYEIKTKPSGGGIQLQTYDLPVALVKGGEAFDMYDLYGYTVNYMGDAYPVRPLVEFQIPAVGQAPFFNPFYNKLDEMISWFNGIMPNATHIHFPKDRDYHYLFLRDHYVNRNISEFSGAFGMKNGASEAIWGYSMKYITGIGNVQMPANRTVWKPHGALSPFEISQAMAATQQQQNLNIQNVQLQIIVPPNQNQGGGMGANVNQNIQNTNVPVYPLVNLSDWLAIRDYSHAVLKLWTNNSPINRHRSYWVQQNTQALLFRDQGTYTLQWGNEWTDKRFNYNWNRPKPKLVF